MEPGLNNRLDSWKEIAAYLKREVRTVQRWERLEGLPVHRHQHQKRGSVYALKPELDAWQAGRQLQANRECGSGLARGEAQEGGALVSPRGEPGRVQWLRGSLAALSACFLALLVFAGYLVGRHARPETPWQSLERAQGTGAPVLVTVGDFNGDGKMEVALARPFSHSISLFFGSKEGGFEPQTSYSVPGTITGMAAADFDRDGRSDLAVAADSRRVIILLADGNSIFRQHQEISVPGVSTISAADLNGNGTVDLLAGGHDPASLVVLWGKGDGTFTLSQPVNGARVRSSAALLGAEASLTEQ